MRMHMRSAVTYLVLVFASLSHPALAQDPAPPIPWVVVDVHGSFPRFPSDDTGLANSRNMDVAELPGTGLGAQFGLHIYPVHTRVITIGIGGELAIGHSSKTPLPEAVSATLGRPLLQSEEHLTSLSPQLSLNFGNGSGWSYLSAGLGASTLSLSTEALGDYPGNSDRLKTFNYGGGARWFVKPHLAFSFDVRFYSISPGFAYTLTVPPFTTLPGTPHTSLLIIAAGISLK
jgi:hypothetical protein